MKEKIKKHKKVWVIPVILLVVAAIVYIPVRKKIQSGKQIKKREIPQNTISLEKMDLTTSVSATGTIASSKSKTVSADVNGMNITKIHATVGESVEKGEVLVSFDESELEESLAEVQDSLADANEEGSRNLVSAKKQYKEAKKTYEDEKKALMKKVQEAKGEVEQQKKNAGAAKSAEEKAKAEESLKQAETAYENAVSNKKTTNRQNKEKVENAKDNIETARSNKEKTIREVRKQVREIQKTLEQCEITAPISGVITSCGVEEGDTYSGGTMFQIEDTSSYTVTTTVDEYDISKIQKGQRVVILTEATGEDELEGEISFVAPSTASTSISSGNAQSVGGADTASSSGGYEVTIDVLTKDERLRMGLTAKCSIVLEEAKDVFAVPYDAVHENSDGTTVVYVSEEMGTSISKREVTVSKGMESDYYVEIRGDELTEGMQIQIPTEETSTQDSEETSEKAGFSMPGGGEMPGGGQMPDGGTHGGGNRGGGGNMGRPGM